MNKTDNNKYNSVAGENQLATKLSAFSLSTDTFLFKMALAILKSYMAVVGWQEQPAGLDKFLLSLRNKRLRVGSVCGGTEMGLACCVELMRAYSALKNYCITVEHIFSIEYDDKKRALGQQVSKPHYLFKDVLGFKGKRLFDHLSGTRMCKDSPKLKVDFLEGGFSCKDLSALKNRADLNNCLARGKGSSGRTWQGCCAVASATKPRVVLFENVPGILHKINRGAPQIETVKKDMERRKYQVAWDCHILSKTDYKPYKMIIYFDIAGYSSSRSSSSHYLPLC